MKRGSGSWTYLLKTETGRQVLWWTVGLSAASLVGVGMAFSLEGGRPGGHIVGFTIREHENVESEEVPSSYFTGFFNRYKDYFLVLKGIDTAASACKYYTAIGAIQEHCGDIIFSDPALNNFTSPDAKGFFYRHSDGIFAIPVGIKLDCAALQGTDVPCDDWKQKNGFNSQDVRVSYFNAGDLGFGRAMHGTTTGGGKNIAYYVCNLR
jgi:hypothetical protein